MTRDEQELLLSMLESFVDSGLVAEVMEFVKGGKEATVFRCRAGERTGTDFFAAKVYRPQKYRRFRDDADYQNGRVILDARAARAVKKRTAFGREAHQGMWVGAEFETQQMLYDAGVDVPRPVECNGDAIVMEWVGDAAGPAPQLKDVRLERRQAHEMLDRLLRDVETLLAHNRIHGDLSPFNVLVWDGRPRIIDFPQAVDPRMNRNAYALLHRDIDNLCRFFAKFGVTDHHAGPIAGRMWERFVRGRL
jgi:RIO kinase 1